MTRTPCPYDDPIHYYPYNLIVAEPGHLCCAGTRSGNPSPLLPHTNLHLNATHTYNSFQSFVPSYASHSDESYPTLQPMHSSYSLLPVGSMPPDDAPTDHRNLGSPQSSEIYIPWNLIRPLPDRLSNATYGVLSPSLPNNPTLNPGFQPPPGSIQVSPVEGLPQAPSSYHLTTTSAGPSPHHLNFTSDPYSATSNASYPCLWTDSGIICNAMVQATRSHMNRHLHTSHGFSGSETRQTRCCWSGCGEMMQQGSIARHMVTCHLQAKVTCPMCYKKLSRQDVVSKHQRVCPAASALR